MDRIEALERLARLRDTGVLSDEEFQREKQELTQRALTTEQTSSARAHSGDSARMRLEYDAAKKSIVVAYLFWFFLFSISAHRLYLHRWKTALLQMLLIGCAGLGLVGGAAAGALVGVELQSETLLTMGPLLGMFAVIVLWGIWILVDALMIPSMVRDYNQRLIDTL